jgi:AcrR family transcriptional regulator
MLKAGVELLCKGGFDAVDVRSVCRRAEANPGLFHYYFRTKRSFMDQAMGMAYESFFDALEKAASSKSDPRERLEETLVTLGKMARANRALLGSLTRSAKGKPTTAGEDVVRQLTRFSGLLEQLVSACAPRQDLNRGVINLSLVEAAIAAPLLWSALDRILGDAGRPPRLESATLEANAFSEEAIRARVKAAIENFFQKT